MDRIYEVNAMTTSLPRILSLLRQEKGISQRQAASELGISQALLSHYENGVREPGLPFICKVCEYYNVSADYLLGRTSIRDGAYFDAQSLLDSSLDKDETTRTSALALMDKTFLNNAMSILFDMLGKLGEEDAIGSAYQFLGSAIYRLFRQLSNMSPDGKAALFEVSDLEFAFGAANADMILNELVYAKALHRHEAEHKPFPPAGYQALKSNYPDLYQSLLQIIHDGGIRVTRMMETHMENLPK